MTASDALRPWATSAAVNRELRAMHSAALDAIPSRPLVFVVALAGAFRPESIPAGAWREVEGKPVAVAPLETARDIAAGRSPGAARTLDTAPPAGGCWCIAIAADGSSLTWSTPLVFTREQVDPADSYGPSQGDA